MKFWKIFHGKNFVRVCTKNVETPCIYYKRKIIMSNILKMKQFPEVEKCKIIQHLKNEIRIIGDDFKTNNIDLLIHVMNFVEMYFTGHKMGKVKEEVVRRVLDKFTADFLDQMIPFVLEKKLLIPKSIINTILNFFKKKNLQNKLNQTSPLV